MHYFAWPGSIVVIAIFFMVFFHKDISALLARIQKISKEGILTSSHQPQKVPESKSTAEELMRAFDSKVLLEQETSIKKDLERRGLSNQQETLNVLVRHLAATQLALFFEYVNTLIWGSQVGILQHLNSTPQGETSEKLKSFYDYAAIIYPDAFANYSIEQYLGFLVTSKLITQIGDQYLITDLGRDFLGYLVNTGRTGFRPL